MPKLTPRQLATVLVEQAVTVSAADLPRLLKGFVAELSTRNMLHQWRAIEREIHGAWKRKFGAANITVVSTHKLTRTMMSNLEALAPGADIVEKVDERLMGGAIVRIDDRRIDGSVLGALQRLKQHLDKVML